MEDKKFENLFSNLLDTFPFSIKGYENAEDEFAAAFKRLYENEFLKNQSHFTFLISGFAKLKEDKIQAPNFFENWDTRTLRKFLFHDFKFGLAEFALSLYVYSLRILSPEKSVNKLITSNFRNNVILSVKIKDDIESIGMDFITTENTLEIQVPIHFYKHPHFKYDEYKKKFATGLSSENSFLVKEDTENPSEFEIVSNDSVNALYEKLLEQLMSITPVSFKEQLDKMDFENENFLKSIKEHLHNDSANLRDLLIVGYVNSILCYLYQSNIYYFLSVAMVNRNMKYTLGGIGVGTKADAEITKETMSFFNIVSNHISSNLAVQIIYDNLESFKLEVESYKSAILTQPLGKSLYALNQTLNNKVPFPKSGIHYKHVQSLIDYAKSNSIEENKVWERIEVDVINVFDTVMNRIGELNETWKQLKDSIQQKSITDTEKYFVEIESHLESKIVIDNNPLERIYFSNATTKVELFFVKNHIDLIIKGIRKNAETWKGLTSDSKLKSVHQFLDGKLSVIFHVVKEPVADFESFKSKATESEQPEKLGGMITILNKLYHAEMKFVSKSDTNISSLHYSKGVHEPNEITIDSGTEYSELQNGLHYQIIFK